MLRYIMCYRYVLIQNLEQKYYKNYIHLIFEMKFLSTEYNTFTIIEKKHHAAVTFNRIKP